MKKTFRSFDLGIDHLFSSEPEEGKEKKEEQQRFACIDVSKLDGLVEGVQSEDNKICNKIPSERFQGIFAFNYSIKFSKSHSVF